MLREGVLWNGVLRDYVLTGQGVMREWVLRGYVMRGYSISPTILQTLFQSQRFSLQHKPILSSRSARAIYPCHATAVVVIMGMAEGIRGMAKLIRVR